MTVWHVDETGEFLPVALKIEVKEFDQKSVDSENAGVDSHLRLGILYLFNLPLLLENPHLDHLLYLGRLLEFYAKEKCTFEQDKRGLRLLNQKLLLLLFTVLLFIL
jgi:hypothetical protein